MAKKPHIEDLPTRRAFPELNEEESAWVRGGFVRPLQGHGDTETTIDTIYPDRPPTDDSRPDCD